MPENSKHRITIEPQASTKRMEETREIVVDQTYIIVEILSREYGTTTAESFKIHRPFFTSGEITDEAKQLIIEALKKRPGLVTITPKVIEDLPEIIIRYMEKLGYDVNKIRERIRVLSTKPRER
jgi:phosphoenolpyruvate-protein kinase (PTS system EI component)